MESINQFVLANEEVIRLTFFIGIFSVMAIWEIKAPRRQLKISKMVRWFNNLGIVALNTLLLRWLFPAAAVGVAAFAQSQNWGLLNYYSIPFEIAVILSVIAMDFVIYLQHVMVHSVPALWRLHRVHHADQDYDVTTGARFHPIEIILSMLIKLATVVVLGPPIMAVIIFEVLLNALAMFNHGNVGLPKKWDQRLRYFVVTPDMHRVHHSVEDDETNSNFGFNLTWWDRLFGTYREQPRAGHTDMQIGIFHFEDEKMTNQLPGMLMLPFKGKVTEYAINTRRWQPNEKNSEDEIQ